MNEGNTMKDEIQKALDELNEARNYAIEQLAQVSLPEDIKATLEEASLAVDNCLEAGRRLIKSMLLPEPPKSDK